MSVNRYELIKGEKKRIEKGRKMMSQMKTKEMRKRGSHNCEC